MKSGYVKVKRSMADPDPPQPMPLPIRIVADLLTPLQEDDDSQPLVDIPSSKRNDEFYSAWDNFLAIEPKRAKSASTPARKLQQEREAVEHTPGDGLRVVESAATSYKQAAAECRAKVNAIVDECQRLNQKYRDAIFDLETNPYCLQSLTGRFPKAVETIDPPPWIKRVEDIFDDPQLVASTACASLTNADHTIFPRFFVDGAAATDVHQGGGGDCWFLAALMAVSAKKELIENLCVARDEKVGVYGFVFFRDGEWIYEVIDDKLFLKVGDDDDLKVVRDWDKEKKEGLPLKHDEDKLKDGLQRGGEALYFSHCKSNETWLPLIEKAYAKAHGDYYSIEGGFASEAIEDLTGGVGVVLNPEDILDKELFWRDQLSQVNKKFLFGGGSKPANSKGFIGSHAYAVLEAWEEGDLKLLKLRNPWGEVEWEGDWSDGSRLWTAEMMTKLNHTFGDDGVFWISFKDFLKHFTTINRVRLFDENWKVAQQWTSVVVPWTVDYLDTKFQFTITEKGPVVIVLSQPDDRYFYGLGGRYLYSMHFRVYKEGEENKWIVRSMHNSGAETVFTRSVSAEIEDLEASTYDVMFKVTAVRSNVSQTAEEAILKYAVDRKEKLLYVGRRFDYAHTKGNLRAMEEKCRKRAKRERRQLEKEAMKKARKVNQKEKERDRKRKKRINDAMKNKRKTFELIRREKEKPGQQLGLNRQGAESSQALSEHESEKATKMTPLTDSEVSSSQQIAQQQDPPRSSTTAAQEKHGMEKLTDGLSSLDIRVPRVSQRTNSESVLEESSGYESPLEPPEELDDNDFDWDSELDWPADSSDEEGGSSQRKSKNELFADDPWSALCVLGIRVYSLNSEANVRVIKNDWGF